VLLLLAALMVVVSGQEKVIGPSWGSATVWVGIHGDGATA